MSQGMRAEGPEPKCQASGLKERSGTSLEVGVLVMLRNMLHTQRVHVLGPRSDHGTGAHIRVINWGR